jgi:DNA polymerase-1
MEAYGIKIDITCLQKLSTEFQKEIEMLEKEIFSYCGQEFNIASPKQLGGILFDKLQLPFSKISGKSKTYGTGVEILEKLSDEGYEIADLILKYRHLTKLKNTYTDALPKQVDPITSRLHTTFLQTSTTTGRLSSNNPNVQNIPIRTPEGNNIRAAFIAPTGYKLISADYSQIELRILSHVANIQALKEAFIKGEDIHKQTASQIFGVEMDKVTPELRRNAKAINFGIIYGVSAFGLAAQLAISRTEAKEIIDQYFVEFPKVKTFMDQSITDARENGYVETVLGRRRYLRDILSANMNERGFAERNAINAPIQGSAADMIKVAMIQIQDFIERENLKSKMILTVHDELVFDAHKDEVDYLKVQINKIMCEAMDLGVAMETGIGVGENWLEAH